MKLDDSLFVNRALKGDMPHAQYLFALSNAVLIDRIKAAEHVLIISAYYDIGFLQTLFEHKDTLANTNIAMVFARPAPSALPAQIEELRKFQSALRGRGKSKARINVAVAADGGRFLHTKLYQFRRGKWMRTLIGSANATSNGFDRNDEILLEVKGRSGGIDQYVERVVKMACNCESVIVSSNEQYTSFQSMLRDGYIYFKPSRSVPYTLNCFDNDPERVGALQRTISSNPLPFHEGQSVGMLNILRLLDIKGGERAAKQDVAQRVKIIPFSVETAFGYWVPSAFQRRLEDRLDATAEKKMKALLACGQQLAARSDKNVLDVARTRYVSVINERLASVSARLLNDREARDVNDRVLRRVKSLRERLNNEEECMRLARSYDGTPVPEIWEDPQSKNEMIDSFCECVAWKLNAPTRLPQIVQRLRDGFDLKRGDEAHTIRRKIEGYFKTERYSRNDWEGEEYDEFDEESGS
jgi:NgoFVII restriction endonuclease